MQRRDFLGWLGLAAVTRTLPAIPIVRDDTARIQGMIDRAAAEGGGIVQLEPSTYYLRAPLIIHDSVGFQIRGSEFALNKTGRLEFGTPHPKTVIRNCPFYDGPATGTINWRT